MNDFTLDELQIILLEMNISIDRAPKQLKVSPIFIQLRDKIESMIEDYPEVCTLCGSDNCQECPCR